LTETEHNPPTDTPTAPPSRALLITRVVISAGLCVGVLVFGVLAFEQLRQAPAATHTPQDFGKSSDVPELTIDKQDLPALMKSLGRPDASKYIPILRENPHPGSFTPFLNAAPYGQPPYRQPEVDGVVWEHCAYRTTEPTNPDAAVTHYAEQALARGLDLKSMSPTSDRNPGGIRAAWSDGRRTLEVTAWPTPGSTQVTRPPLKPMGPLDWVVKYSYPE